MLSSEGWMINSIQINLQTRKLRATAYHIDPIFYKAKKIDQRIKGTLGITGW